MHVLTAGDPSHPAILLLHGMAFQASTWQDLGTLELLANAGFYAVALDLPGFGLSPASHHRPENIVRELLQALPLNKPVIVGPSMGGRVALEFALAHQQLLSALILVGAVGVEENRDRLSALTLNTLIVWGANDHISSPSSGRLLDELLPASQLIIIQNAKHACYLEQPEEWHHALLKFVSTYAKTT